MGNPIYYDELLNNPIILLYDLNFRVVNDPLNCPATADALDNYLTSGVRLSALTRNRRPFRINARFGPPGPIGLVVAHLNSSAIPPPTHVVVHGHRAHRVGHYFVMLKHRGQVWLADPYIHVLLDYPGRVNPSNQTNQTASYLAGFVGFSFTHTFDAYP